MSFSNPKQIIEEKIDWGRKKIRFSFEFYDVGHSKYCFSNWSEKQILLTLKRLKDITTKSLLELKSQHSYRFHEVYWNKTIHKTGFNNSSVNELPPFQFALIGVNGQLARVFGAYAEGVFYLVWFDLEHKIWPSPLRNT